MFFQIMKEMCKIVFDDPSSGCGGKKADEKSMSENAEKISFGVNRLSPKDFAKKKEAKETLIRVTKRCILDGECKELEIQAFRWKKCDICDEHLPFIQDKIIKPLREAGIPVSYTEMDAKNDGKDAFLDAGCQGTPCILVKDPNTDQFKKIYDGSKGEIASMSEILGFKNPFFYDISKDKPQNMFISDGKTTQIKNNGSMWL